MHRPFRVAVVAAVIPLLLLPAEAAEAAGGYADAVTGDGPVSYWRFGESSGTTAADVTGANPGSYKSGSTLGNPGALPADADTAVTLNGTSGYVSVPNAASLNRANDLSVEVWAKPAALSGQTQAVIHKGGSTGNSVWQYRIGLTSSNKWRATVYVGTTAITVTDPGTPSVTAYTHLVMTAGQGRLTFYVNGASVGTATYSGILNTSTGVLAIGRTGSASTDYFRGSIDEAAFYPSALSATQVANHYGVGSARPPAPPTAAFTAAPTSGDAPLAVAFTDLSTGDPTAWAWDFGDGTNSTQRNPAHTYTTPGTYTVSLTATNIAGSSTDSHPAAVTVTTPPAPVAAFIADKTSGPAPLTVTFTDQSAPTPTAWQWDFGDGSGSTERSPQHTYAVPGSYDVTLSVTNTGGSGTLTRPAYVVADHADPVIVGAGDIADCASSGDEATAALVAGIPGTVFTVGDNVYDNGTPSEFANCYDPSWGQFKDRTHPAVGNHEYNTPGAAGYYGYFGAAAADPTQGWYSYDVGAWHVVVLNSECTQIGGCGYGRAEEQWLRADLAAHPTTCTAAIWHEPRYSSGTAHGDDNSTTAFWEDLYYAGADLVINGHDHDYERFAPMNPRGEADPTHGLREFVVGTGGKNLTGFGNTIQPNSVVHDASTFGVLKLTLHDASYDWQFVPVAGGTGFTDAGTANCVTTPAPPPPAPVADFTTSTTGGDAPLAVTFTDRSTGQPAEWSWDFGDNSTSTAQNPIHTYAAAGAYTVRLTVRSYSGSDTAVRTDLITVTIPAPPDDYASTVAADGPSGYWRLGETSGSTTADATGAPSGAIKGGVTLGQAGALIGDPNTAMGLDGSTGYISVANRTGLNSTGDFTVEAWVKPATVGGVTGAIVHKGGSTGNAVWQYRLSLTSTGKWRGTAFSGSTAFQVTDPGTPVVNAWTYLALTRSGDTLTLYVNGLSVAMGTMTGATNTSTGLFAIGRTGSASTDYFKGAIDEAAFYPTALSSSRIFAHYTAGTN